jgi:hypothetical protein
MGFDIGGYKYNSQMASTEVYKAISQRGLKLNLDASSVDSYSGAGTTWYDLTTNSYNGTLNGSPTFSSNSGGYLSFNGTNQDVSISSVINAYPFTVNFWATHPNSWVSTIDPGLQQLLNMSIAGQRVSIGCVKYTSYGWTVGPTLMYGGTNHWSTSAVSAGMGTGFTNVTWVVYGSNDTRHQIYVNGVAQTMVNNGLNHGGTAGWKIASDGYSSEYWPGNIGSVQIYNRVMDTTEVLLNYNIQKSRFGL